MALPMKTLLAVLITGVVWYLATTRLGMVGFWGILTLVILIVGTLEYFGKVKLFRYIPLMNKQILGIVILISLVAQIFFFGLMAKMGISGLFPAEVSGDFTDFLDETETAVTGDCRVSDELRGKSATVKVCSYDKEANTKTAIATDMWAYYSGTWTEIVRNTDIATTCTDISDVVVGDTIDIYGGNATSTSETYHMDAQYRICVDRQQMVVNMDAHKWQAETSYSLTGYDTTGATALTTGTTNEEDYEIALGASEETNFYIKIKNNGADQMIRFCGYAVRTNGDVSDAYPLDGCFESDNCISRNYDEEPEPTYLKGVINVNTTGNINLTGYDSVWITTPVDLHEWEEIKDKWYIKCDDTGCDARDTGNSDASTDGVWILVLDCAWTESKNGQMEQLWYQNDDSEGNVGLTETTYSPHGKTTGMVIEAT